MTSNHTTGDDSLKDYDDIITTHPRLEGIEDEIDSKEMDILKDLPSYNSSNFSKFSPSSVVVVSGGKSNSHQGKTHVRLKKKADDYQPQVIVMESKSLILRELEVIIKHQEAKKRTSLKRSSSCRLEHGSHSSSSSCKFPRTDITDDDSIDSWDM